MHEFGKVKVIVAGDSGVGKTAFVHLLCYDEALLNPSWTVGCNVELMVFPKDELADFGRNERNFVELWDIGGSASHKNTRSVFYEKINGVILVHDLTNKKSEANLKKWLGEIHASDSLEVVCHSKNAIWRSSTGITQPLSLPSGTLKDSQTIPVLVVGTKLDQTGSRYKKPQINRKKNSYNSLEVGQSHSVSIGIDHSVPFSVFSSPVSSKSFAMQHQFPEILINCNDANGLSLGSYNAEMLSDFLHNVVQFKKKARCLDDKVFPTPASSLLNTQYNPISHPTRIYTQGSGDVTYRMGSF